MTCTAVSPIKPWKRTCVEVITSVMQSVHQRMNCFYCFPMMYRVMLLGKLNYVLQSAAYRVGFLVIINYWEILYLCMFLKTLLYLL